MITTARITAALALMALCASAHASASSPGAVEALVRAQLPARHVAVYAGYMDRADALVDIDGDRLIPPASTVKIITAAAALAELGVDYRFVTEFLSDARPAGGVISTLYIRGNGDPYITPQTMWRMAGELIDHGYRHIDGDVVIDQSFFDGPEYPRKDNGGQNAYEALTAAVAANFNVVQFIITPADRPGLPAHISVHPPTPYVRVVNRVTTGARTRLGASRTMGDDHELFVVSGEIKLQSRPSSLARSIGRPGALIGSLFAAMLAQRGIELGGTVREGSVPKGAHALFESPSLPLALIVRDMNKYSSNFIAEQLVKHLGGNRTGKAGTTAAGLVALREWLASIGIQPRAYRLENGSGLTDDSAFSARQLVTVIRAAGTDPAIGPDFLASLSLLGVDGTMRTWQTGAKVRGTLRAKTGTLKGVANLAGVIPDEHGRLIAFAVLTSGLHISIEQAREAGVRIAEALAKTR